MMRESTPPRRPYDSPLRRQRAAATRERIVAAGSELLHGFPIWNWRAVTIPAVAARAGVSERTVYRHFRSERELRDAVMARMREEARIDFEQLRLDDLRDITSRIFDYVSAFPFERVEMEPTLEAIQAQQRNGLLAAVTPFTEDWTAADRVLAAAVLDVVWNYGAYAHLLANWDLDPKEAIRGITWLMGLAEAAIREGRPPE